MITLLYEMIRDLFLKRYCTDEEIETIQDLESIIGGIMKYKNANEEELYILNHGQLKNLKVIADSIKNCGMPEKGTRIIQIINEAVSVRKWEERREKSEYI